MQTVPETQASRKAPIAFYGWLHEQHGIFLQADGVVSFRDSATETWQPVDLPTLTTWTVLNGRVDLADLQQLLDGDRVYTCSRTLQAVA